MKGENKKIPCIFYLYIHSKICERSTCNLIRIKEATNYLHEWRIPREIRVAIIKEMEILGLLKKINKTTFRTRKSEIDFNNTNQIYNLVGLCPF